MIVVRRLRSAMPLGAAIATAVLALGCRHAGPRAAPGPGPSKEGAFIAARVRRMSNIEYERTVSELVGAPQSIAGRLPPDVRQEG